MPAKVKKVFISHGHNEIVKHKLKDFIKDRLNLEPVILADQPDNGLTVIEKLEKAGKKCDFALIVLTTDDKTADNGVRARQNVIHELGFFHGSIGRDRVLLLKQSGVELFSNISGLIYKEFNENNIEQRFEDIREAVEQCSAQKGGQTVYKIIDANLTSRQPNLMLPISGGDIVELKIGGQKMTVESVIKTADGNSKAKCSWFSGGKVETHYFDVNALKLSDDSTKGSWVTPVPFGNI